MTNKKEVAINIQEIIKNAPKIPICIQMLQPGFDFITAKEKIANKEKYKAEHMIIVQNKDSELKEYQGRIIYNDGSKEIIDLFEVVTE